MHYEQEWLTLALRLMRNLPLWLLVPVSVLWSVYMAYCAWSWPNTLRPARYVPRHHISPDRTHVRVAEVLARSHNAFSVRQQFFMLAWRDA